MLSYGASRCRYITEWVAMKILEEMTALRRSCVCGSTASRTRTA